MDTITISENYFNTVLDWTNKNRSLLIEGGFITKNTILPLESFFLILEAPKDKGNNKYIKVKGKTFDYIDIGLYDYLDGNESVQFTVKDFDTVQDNNKVFHYEYNIALDGYVDWNEKLQEMSEEEINEKLKELCVYCSRAVYVVLVYLLFHKQELELEKKTVQQRSGTKKKKGGKSKKKGKVYIDHHYKLNGLAPRNKNSTFTRKTESWIVRGHPRKYKDGRIIFIKPFVKGTGKREDTHYQL